MTATIGRAALERMLASAAFNASYGFRVGPIGDGTCTIEVPFKEEFLRPGDVVSGPVFMAAADAATWLAIATRLGAEHPWVTVDLKTAFIRAARREPFTCTGRVVKLGRRLIYAVAECAPRMGRC